MMLLFYILSRVDSPGTSLSTAKLISLILKFPGPSTPLCFCAVESLKLRFGLSSRCSFNYIQTQRGCGGTVTYVYQASVER
jgi:hypothetical protein